MEVSSHALEQQRIGDSFYKAAAFTNLSHEHLDYHGDMESSFAAKEKLFSRCEKAVVGIDDAYGRRLIEDLLPSPGRSSPSSPLLPSRKGRTSALGGLSATPTGWNSPSFIKGKNIPSISICPGVFSVRNFLAAAGLCLSLGLPLDRILPPLQAVEGVKGRDGGHPDRPGLHRHHRLCPRARPAGERA